MGFFSALSKSAINTALDFSQWGLLIFGLILTLGALGEYKVLPGFFLKRIPHKIFEFMVAIGIAGEFIADGGVFLFSRHLQTINDSEYASLNNEAGLAKTQAGRLEIEAATLRKEAEDEALSRSKIEAVLTLSGLFPPERIDEAIKKLSTFSGQRFFVSPANGGENGIALKREVGFILTESKWTVSPNDPGIGGMPSGIVVRSTSDDKSVRAATDLAALLGLASKTRLSPEKISDENGPLVYVWLGFIRTPP